MVPGVFGIDVDRAGLERLREDRGVSEARLVDRARAREAGSLGDDLAQDVGLGEALGAHAQDGLVRRRRARGEARKQENDEDRTHGAMIGYVASAPI